MFKINKPIGKVMLALFYVAIFIIGIWLPLPRPKAFAAGCYGSSCHGYNPNTMGCNGSTYHAKTYGSALVQNRYASNCNADWARTINVSGGLRYAAASERYGGASYNYAFNVSSPAKIASNARVYTAMVAPASTINTKACGRASTYGPISTNPYLTYWCLGQH